jgi:hypothetical protein
VMTEGASAPSTPAATPQAQPTAASLFLQSKGYMDTKSGILGIKK